MFSHLGLGDSDMRDERVGAGPAADRSRCRRHFESSGAESFGNSFRIVQRIR
jgi:hypothetical protein